MTLVPFKVLQTFAQFVQGVPWRFAKSMPQQPHWYTLRDQWTDDDQFNEAVNLIRLYGYYRSYRGRQYCYLDLNNHRYWTMGAPIPETILINRAVRSFDTVYDNLAGLYDTLHQDPDSLQEDQDLIAQLPPLDTGRVLDVGCGTGLLLDYCTVPDYLGLDVSQGMLDQLLRKHPERPVIASDFESFYMGAFDTIISLYGAPSYIAPEALSRIPQMLRAGGRYFLVFYAPEYESPVCYARAGIDPSSHFPYTPGVLNGNARPFNKFVIVEGECGPCVST